MTTDQDLAFTPAYELRERIANKELSPVELTELYLRRIEAMNPTLNAFLTVTADQAMEAAQEAEAAVTRGDSLGPLHGIPTSIKDLVPTKGIRTTRGSLVLKDWIPDEDDAVVERIKGAGAIILGKTNTPEFGQSGTTENKLGDDCRNPWNPERVSGGSSDGDGGGSIRIPSSFCGVYGIKGTQGRVPRKYPTLTGYMPVNFSQIGPMSRTVRDAAIFLQVMAGPHPGDQGSAMGEPPDFIADLEKGVKGLRMGWSPDLGSAAVDPKVAQVVEKAAMVFEELGATVEPAPLHLDIAAVHAIYRTLTNVGHYLANGPAFEETPELLMDYVYNNIKNGKAITGREYATATSELAQHRARRRVLRQLRRAADSDAGGARLPLRTAADGHRRKGRGPQGVLSVHLRVQHVRQPRRQRAMRLLLRRHAHRAAHRGPPVRRGHRAPGLRRLRAGPALG